MWNSLKLRKKWDNLLKRLMPPGKLAPQRDEFYQMFPPQAKVRCLASGFQFTEGPVWIVEEGCLLFSDIPGNRIYQWQSDRGISLYREPSHHANGLTRDQQGRLLACEHGPRRVTRTSANGEIKVLTSTYRDLRLNSPNDIVVKRDGSIYFTDPPYGIKFPEKQDQPHSGVYRIGAVGEEPQLLIADFIAPNGLAFSPDERRLYIDDSDRKRSHIRVFDVATDGTLGNGRLFHEMLSEKSGVPDGMKVDRAGHVFCTGAGGVWVFSPDGEHLGTIRLRETPANCAWGDADGRGLYVTAMTSLYHIRVNTPGISVINFG